MLPQMNLGLQTVVWQSLPPVLLLKDITLLVAESDSSKRKHSPLGLDYLYYGEVQTFDDSV